MFTYFKTKIRHRKLLNDINEAEYNLEKEFVEMQAKLGLMFASPSFDFLVEYIEAQIEILRDKLEIENDVHTRAKLEVYRELMRLFNDSQLEDSPLSDS